MAENITAIGNAAIANERVRTQRYNKPRARTFSLLGSLAAHAVMIITVLICILPLVIIISTSFKFPNDVFDLKIIPANPTLSNYQYVLTGEFITWLVNSLKIGSM